MINDGLAGNSLLYKDKSNIYERFSQAEDSDNKILNFLLEKAIGKIVLDFGCGTGRFIKNLAPSVKKYIAMDINESQLKIARSKIKDIKNVEIIKNQEDSIPLADSSVDLIFSTWVIGSIHNLDLRIKILNEFERVLKRGGSIFLIENDVGGEYKKITGGDIVNNRTKEKLQWLKNKGYQEIEKIYTLISFKDLEEAKYIFEHIWDKEAADKIENKDISLNLVVLSK